MRQADWLEAIRARPDDDTPRLAFADWLTERGEADRGEFVRVQCRLAALPLGDARRDELADRQDDLLAEYESAWLGDAGRRLVGWRFRRGFVEEVACSLEAAAESWGELRAAHPVRGMAWVAAGDAPPLVEADFPGLERLSVETTGDRRFRDAVLSWPGLRRLTGLRLAGGLLRPIGGARPLVPLLGVLAGGTLRDLELEGHALGSDAVARLAEWPGSPNLRSLGLAFNGVGPEGVRRLLADPAFAGLRALDVRAAWFGPPSGAPTWGVPADRPLVALDVSQLELRDDMVAALRDAPFLPRLRSLGLGPPTDVTPGDLFGLLERTPALGELSALGPESVGSDLAPRLPPRLHTLSLGCRNLSSGDWSALEYRLSEAPLRVLNLSDCPTDDGTAAWIWRSPVCTSLDALDLGPLPPLVHFPMALRGGSGPQRLRRLGLQLRDGSHERIALSLWLRSLAARRLAALEVTDPLPGDLLLEAIASAGSLPALRELRLTVDALSVGGFAALARSRALQTVRAMDLRTEPAWGEAFAREWLAAPGLGALRTLPVRGPLQASTADALRARFGADVLSARSSGQWLVASGQ